MSVSESSPVRKRGPLYHTHLRLPLGHSPAPPLPLLCFLYYKLFWSGDEAGSSGVAILIAERWINNVIRVDRVNERLMSLDLRTNKRVVTIVSAYAPQQGLPKGLKDKFYETLTQHVKNWGKGPCDSGS